MTLPSEAEPPASETTPDTLFGGRLRCRQPRTGYRFSIDAVLLAHFSRPKPGAHILDLGTGCGIIPLILAFRQPSCRGIGVEIQPELAELARRNLTANGFDHRWQVVEGDYRQPDLLPAGVFDLVLANPPYRKTATGRRNPHPGQALARHELSVDLQTVLRAMARAVKTRGRTALIYPAARTAALLAALRNADLEPKRLRVVHSYPGGHGRLVLVETVKGGGEELTILPPFFVYREKSGPYSEEMRQLYAV